MSTSVIPVLIVNWFEFAIKLFKKLTVQDDCSYIRRVRLNCGGHVQTQTQCLCKMNRRIFRGFFKL